ncbi:hypothetical protein CPB84DRAFT_1848339 [Gymnopilus junonius]|uniref:Uncharacterized protein n=1 Tax=Gymnopilus junonius TaxID=109634 RepID=A0A9P5TKY2_GYMJU|nr:hypothetical protein CPB84DRAFT_1848339 [Gymnopilus junonius]
MDRPAKRQRLQLQRFHSDWVSLEDDEGEDFVHVREGGLGRKGNHVRMSVMPREAERALGMDSWVQATFWPTPNSTEFALDMTGDLYDEALEADVMDELPSPEVAATKSKWKISKVSVRRSLPRSALMLFALSNLLPPRRDHMLYGKSSIDKFFWTNFFAGQAVETFEVPSSVLTAWLGLKLQLNHAGSFCENPIPAHTNMLVLHTNALPGFTYQNQDLHFIPITRTPPQIRLNDEGFHLRLLPGTREVDNQHRNGCPEITLQAAFPNDTSMVPPQDAEVGWQSQQSHRRINLPEDWVNAPKKLKFLFMMIMCMDANFRLKNQLVSNYSQDPGLGVGWAYLVPRQAYESYVLSRASDEDISTCVGFQALVKANSKFSVGLRYTGVGAVVCGRSEMIFPSGVGNLQKGERYTNMDYIFGSVLQYVLVLLVLISYDIACQWFTNLFSCIDNHWPDSIKPRPNTTLVPAIPKLHKPMHEQKDHQVYSLNLIKGVGFSDCKCPEQVWAPHNALSNSTKTQGPGSHQDVLDDHFGFWNWLKYIGLGSTLLRWYKAAVAQCNLQQEGHRGLTVSLDPDLVQKWETMCQDWEANSFPKKAANPYHLDGAYMSEAQIKKELAEEEERRIAEGGVSLHETSAAGFIQMGLDLEEAQRRLKHLNEHNSLRIQLRAWEKLLPIYIPGLLQYETNLLHSSATSQKGEKGSDKLQDTPEGSSSNKPEDAVLWLPSRIPALVRSQVCLVGLPEIEEWLRGAQCMDSLRKLCRILRVKRRMIHFKNKNLHGQRDGTRSRSVIDCVHLKARNAADRYRASRAAKLELAGPGKWEETFRPLNDGDIRGYQDPNHLHPKAGRPGTLEDDRAAGPSTAPNTGDNQEFELFNEVRTRRDGTGETRRTLSWIWLTIPSNDSEEDKDDILRVEWAKSRARATRATEEVMLLKEEMRRVLAFLEWKSRWWQDRQCTRTGLEKSMAEGVQAFALRQSSLQSQLAAHFRKLWKAPLEDSKKEASNDSHTMPASQKDTSDDNDDDNDNDDDDADEQLEGGLDNDWDDNILEEEED